MADDKVNLIFAAVDKLSADVNAIDKKLKALEQTTKQTSTAVQALKGHLGAIGSVLQGAAIGFGIRIFDALSDAIHRVADAIPDLIERGAAWGNTVRHIADLTGLAADKSSILAGVATLLGQNTDDLGTAFARLGANLVKNPGLLKQWGVSVQGATSQSDLAWQVISKLRDKVAQLGPSFLTTGDAAQLFGRGAKSIIEFLTASPAEFAALAQEVQAAGGVLTEQGLAAARAWEIAQNRINFQITSIGSMIFQGVAPALTGLVDAITNAIRANMDQIVRFVVQVVGFVAGVISGFLGIDLSVASFSTTVADTTHNVDELGPALDNLGKQATATKPKTDTLTDSYNSQIKAIDRQIEALDRLAKRRDEQRERDRLLTDINTARAQLDDLKTKGLFLAGMTETEKELARQKQAADIIDAEKALADAKQALADHDRQVALDQQRQMLEDQRKHLEDLLAAHRKALSNISGANQNFLQHLMSTLPKTGTGIGKDIGTSIGTAMSGAIQSALTDATQAGKQFAETLKDSLFGPTRASTGQFTTTMAGAPSLLSPTQRSGGLIDKIGELTSTIGQAVTTLAGWFGAGSVLDNASKELQTLLNPTPGGLWKLLFGGDLPPSLTGPPVDPYQAPGLSPTVPYGTTGSISGGGIGGIYGAAFTPQMAAQLLAGIDITAQNTGPYGAIAQTMYDSYFAQREGADASADTANQVANGVTVQGDSLSLIGAHTLTTASNTNPIADGTLGVNNAYFGNLPGINTKAGYISTNTNPLADGSLGVNNSQFSYLGNYLPGINSKTGATAGALTNTWDASYGTYIIAQRLSTVISELSNSSAYGYAGSSLYRLDAGFRSIYPNHGFATGGAGLTSGPMNAVWGEAGREAYAILRNPRQLPGGGYAAGDEGGGSAGGKLQMVEQHTHLYLDKREIGEIVTEWQIRHGMATDTSWSSSR